MEYTVKINGKLFEATVEQISGTQSVQTPFINQEVRPSYIVIPDSPPLVNIEVSSPAKGSVKDILVGLGQNVQEGQILAKLKVENIDVDIKAPSYGFVKQILVNMETLVDVNDILLVIA